MYSLHKPVFIFILSLLLVQCSSSEDDLSSIPQPDKEVVEKEENEVASTVGVVPLNFPYPMG